MSTTALLAASALPVALAALLAAGYPPEPGADAHTDPEADVPWFFERTVLIQSGGRTFAGIVWDNSTVITAQHGVYNQTEVAVTDARGAALPAAIIYADQYSDVAILSASTGMAPLEMSFAGPGDPVYAVGHPSGRPYVVTGGIISSVERGPPITIQHDAATATGSSGGPLFDHSGRLVGMNAASDGLSFAVPHHIITNVVESVRETGEYSPGCVGVKLDGGVVRAVRDEVAGTLRPGDIILSVDGGEPYDLVYDRRPGEIVEVVLEDRSVLVQLGRMGEWFGIHRCLYR